jgi:hypothetical protein
MQKSRENKPTRSLEIDENQPVGLETLDELRIQLLRLVKRIERLHDKIDEAFTGQPFLPRLPPDAPANRRRFNVYLSEHIRVQKLLSCAVDLYMVACGMKWEDD